MPATQLALPGLAPLPPAPDPVAAAEAVYLAAVARHRPLRRDPACLTDEAHWAVAVAAQREVETAYAEYVRLRDR